MAGAAPNLTKQAPLDAASPARLAEAYGKLPLSFEANQGQTDRRVKFLSSGSGYTLLLTGDEAVLALDTSRKSKVESRKPRPEPGSANLLSRSAAFGFSRSRAAELDDNSTLLRNPNPESRNPAVLRMKLVSANRSPRVTGLDELPGKSNYFIGSDPAKWQTDVRTYAKVKYEGVYPGVDLVYYGNQRQLEYDFVVAPGADPKAIALEIETRSSKLENRNPKLAVEASGDLVIETDGGEVRFHKPVVYQEQSSVVSRQLSPISFQPQDTAAHPKSKIQNRKLLDGRYVLTADNRVAFEVAAYDATKPLIIDPVMVYSTYLGGVGFDGANGIAVDSSGSAYVTGRASSLDFPLVRPLQAARNGNDSALVTKLNAAGSALVYSTYLGGSFADYGLGIAVDRHGSAYVTGVAGSVDFPTTSGAFQSTLGGGTDAFVTKLNPPGNALVYSTYLGGSYEDVGSSIAVDHRGNAYVTGYTCSTDFPTANSLQGVMGGCYDAFVTKVNHDGSALVYSTYLGGRLFDLATGIAVDRQGSAYVTGWTESTDFPTVDPIQPASGGTVTAFVAKLNAPGNALVYSTYLGGSGQDVSQGIAVGASGSAYVTGFTDSADFPTVNPIQPGVSAFGSAFVTKLNRAGSAFVYSTYLGFGGRGIAVHPSGNAYVTGIGDPSEGHVGVAELNAAGSGLLYSISFGGSDEDMVTGIAVDSSGSAYVTGFTFSGDFPAVNPIQTGHGGEPDSDVFVTKIGAVGP